MLKTLYEFYFGYTDQVAGWVIPAIIGVASIVGSLLSQRKQNKENRKLAEFQHESNKQLLREQLQYDTPKNQMLRFQEAGLNPNLVYGQGSPGNQGTPLSYPEIKPTNYQNLTAALPLINQTAMTRSQTQAIDAKTRQTYAMTELNNLQAEVLRKNPLLDEAGFKAIIDSLKSTAELKAADAGMKTVTSEWFKGEKEFTIDGVRMHGPAGVLKLETELKSIIQKYDLSTQDAAIKAEIIKSKEFQNEIMEVQKRFMTDGDITPQHILMFVQLLLMKLL